jgi:hypothetical protein
MCIKAGLVEKDSQTDRAIIHPHSLRKFFRTHMGTKIGVDITEEIMGHNGYLSGEYRKHTDKELGEAYTPGMNAVTCFEREIPQDLSKVNAQLKEKDDEITQMRRDIQELRLFKERYLETLLFKHEEQINGKKKK